jgi:ATP diphosphatase
MNTPSAIQKLIWVMARLRDPEGGCPWDLEQSFETIAPYTIEEAYEVADAIQTGDRTKIREELGDLLFQVVYYAQMGGEEGAFDFDAIAEAEAEKMIRRHPHVFGDENIKDSDDQTRAWEAHKAAERSLDPKGGGNTAPDGPSSALDGVARALPALVRADKLTKRAARVGFDWESAADVFAKIDEELHEAEHEVKAGADPVRMADEVGDLLFAVANLARKLGLEPESCLRGTNDKFTRRFHFIEARLAADGKTPEDVTLAEMDALWTEAKAEEDPGKP